MRNRFLKLSLAGLFSVLFLLFGQDPTWVAANSSGPPTARTGAPGEQTCAVAGCHVGSAVNSGAGTLRLTGLPANYSPGQEIDLTLTLNQANRGRFGFELTVIDDQGRKAGDLLVTDGARVQRANGVVGANLREYLLHTFNGSSPNGTNQASWNFRWRAPASAVGRITFYFAGNAANNNGQESGDLIYTANASIQPAPVLANVTSVSAASFAQNSPLAADSVASAFGTGLSANVVVASSLPLPTTLDDTQVTVRDITNTSRIAQLFFVAPSQVNYIIPQGTANGAATVTISRAGTAVAQGTITIETAVPGLFSANASGSGVPAAVLFRLKANGQQSFEPLSQRNAANTAFEAIPIDLGPDGEQVFLVAYGTGFRNNTQLSNVTCTIGGANAEVLFAGASPDLAGADQTNIRIPRSLIGRGNVDIVFRVSTRTAKTVTINVK